MQNFLQTLKNLENNNNNNNNKLIITNFVEQVNRAVLPSPTIIIMIWLLS